MHHRRHRAKNRRAGCLLCKPHKGNGMKGRAVCQARAERRARTAMREQLDEAPGAVRRSAAR